MMTLGLDAGEEVLVSAAGNDEMMLLQKLKILKRKVICNI